MECPKKVSGKNHSIFCENGVIGSQRRGVTQFESRCFCSRGAAAAPAVHTTDAAPRA